MICIDLNTDKVPKVERFDWWREWTWGSILPASIARNDDTDFVARSRVVNLGSLTVTKLEYAPIRFHRGKRLIRQSDPEMLSLGLPLRGRLRVAVADQYGIAGQRDFICYDSSRPMYGESSVGHQSLSAHLLVQVPRAMLPLSAGMLDHVMAAPIPSSRGLGPLLADYLTTLVRYAHRCQPTDAARLSTTTLELVSAFLIHHLDADSPLARESQHRLLPARIQRFIQERLGDPRLTPATIAAAHAISLRYLHKLFQQQGLTVAGWIRQRRLERCRADLANPLLANRPINTIIRRWGFTSNAHFSRLFRAAYGISPSDYRHFAYAIESRTPPVDERVPRNNEIPSADQHHRR